MCSPASPCTQLRIDDSVRGAQPEAQMDMRPLMWLGFALTEAVIFYALVGAMLLVVLV